MEEKPPLAYNHTLPLPSILIIVVASCVWESLLWTAEFSTGFTVAENFSVTVTACFPTNGTAVIAAMREIFTGVRWKTPTGFLRAHANQQAVHIGLEYIVDPKLQKHLHWRSRVHALPQGADERDSEKHNAAAQVYVVFDNQVWPRVIKYVWSSALPAGMRFINNPLYNRGRIVILRSGPQEKDKWYEESIDFYEDYKRFLGEEPGKVQGIGILSSSDATKSLVIADYDDFLLLP